jgi:glycerol-3-phosphate dehydrogenase (NAD(P)+)
MKDNPNAPFSRFKSIAVIGAGAWGTALARILSKNNGSIKIWAKEDSVITSINTHHENETFLKNITLPDPIIAYKSFENFADADLILLVTPAQFVRTTLEALKEFVNPETPIVLCSKGIESETLKFMSEITTDILPQNPLAVLSGPSFAIDVARGKPTAVTLACKNTLLGERIASTISLPTFRPYLSDDIMGTQIGGVTKNVIAIAAGIAYGFNLGDSARAAIIARGFSEICRLAITMGGKEETLSGLSGMGDLILTCSSEASRNFSLGVKLGNGQTVTKATEGLKTVAEGLHSAKAVLELSIRKKVEMPITKSVNDLIDQKSSLGDIINNLLSRPIKREK